MVKSWGPGVDCPTATASEEEDEEEEDEEEEEVVVSLRWTRFWWLRNSRIREKKGSRTEGPDPNKISSQRYLKLTDTEQY